MYGVEGTPATCPGPRLGAAAAGSEPQARRWYRLARETGAGRDGRQEVGVAHSTAEAGEAAPGDPVEGRGHRVMEPLEGTMPEASDSDHISPRLQRIAELAEQMPDKALNPLAHNMDEAWLFEAYRRTRKDGAPGVDERTGADYHRDLWANLSSLLDRAKSGRYRAPPVRRTYIPKGDGGQRPLGIPTFEDKLLQRAVVMILEAVYERDFHEGSHGFRPGRSAHQALEAVQTGLMRMGGGWVVKVDIRRFFDTVPHDQLRTVLRRRVGDGVLMRLIGKWLKAGVMEAGQWQRLGEGTPQGGVISPLLANVFLHEVLDEWFETQAKPRLRGPAQLVRYADDAVLLFKHRDDAERVLKVLPKRFEKYGLELHPEKTRLIGFQRPPRNVKRPRPKPETFDLLGFTLYWGRSRRGNWVVKAKTAKDRLSRSLRNVHYWCRQNRHRPVEEQWEVLCRKMKGHYAYYGVTGNYDALEAFFRGVRRRWRSWLARRSQNGQMPWWRYALLLQRLPLPRPRIMKPYARPAT